MKLVLRHLKRGAIFLIGGTILVIGIAMLVLPGPGIPVLIIGLAILATEFAWAEDLLTRAREQYKRLKERRKSKTSS